MPVWAQALGLLLIMALVGLSIEAYFGPGLRNRLLGSGNDGTAAAGLPTRVFYEPGASVRIGQKSIGSEGQERALLEGDTVLLGATGQLVRIGPGGRISQVSARDGAPTTVTNLGAWDQASGRLAGAMVRLDRGVWRMDDLPMPAVGAVLNPPGAPSEALTDGFTIGPDPDAGRVRRVSDKDGQAIRLRASKKVSLFSLDSRQPLPTLDNVVVSVSVLVRAQPGKTMVLAIKDTVDTGGAVVTVTDRQPSSEEWTRLTVRHRMTFRSPNDAYAVGLADVDAGDWFEVRDVQVVLGAAP